MKISQLLFFLCMAHLTYSQQKNELKLWYEQPAGDVWENALPIGNGRLGAMVYGNVSREIIQLNQHTVWSGGPNRNDNPKALTSLSNIRELIFDKKYKEAEALANQTIISKKSHGQKFQPVGNLILQFPDHDPYSNYSRELNIENAIAKTSYTVGAVKYSREVLASLVDTVIVINLTSSKSNSISFQANFTTLQPNAVITTNHSNELIISGTTTSHEGVEGKINFKGIVRIRQQGGSLVSNDTLLWVKNASEATLYISISTNFMAYDNLSGNADKRAYSILNKAYPKSFSAIRMHHVSAYKKYFDCVKFKLESKSVPHTPTDKRLKDFHETDDAYLVMLYFQFGRYLLISSSQPGGQPANLQGIWNNKINPPWDSKYTININAEMNYWPAEKTNLSELHEPFLRMVKELSETGAETARVMYGARGWMAHHNTDLWRTTGAVDGAFWGSWNAGGGWTSQHLWEHYLYTGDTTFLKTIYPVLKGTATFYVDFLVKYPGSNWLVVCPGMSPENAAKSHEGSSIDAGTTMDSQIVFDVFSNTIQAAQILHHDKSFVDTLKQMRSLLPPMHVGKYGQLQEWLEDIDDPADKHRHISHLYGLFPSNQISPYRTPDLYNAAKVTLQQRGDVSTGWSMGWKMNWWARLLDGNHAYKLIREQLTPASSNVEGGGTYNNLFDSHPPFQIDGNFGCVSGIAEMLMQSADGFVYILPSLPDGWPTGSISGLRARGGFEIVDLQWKDHSVVSLTIKSVLGGNLRLRSHNALRLVNKGKLKYATGENPNPYFYTPKTAEAIVSSEAHMETAEVKPSFLYDIPTRAGEVLIFYRGIAEK